MLKRHSLDLIAPQSWFHARKFASFHRHESLAFPERAVLWAHRSSLVGQRPTSLALDLSGFGCLAETVRRLAIRRCKYAAQRKIHIACRTFAIGKRPIIATITAMDAMDRSADARGASLSRQAQSTDRLVSSMAQYGHSEGIMRHKLSGQRLFWLAACRRDRARFPAFSPASPTAKAQAVAPDGASQAADPPIRQRQDDRVSPAARALITSSFARAMLGITATPISSTAGSARRRPRTASPDYRRSATTPRPG